MSLQVLLYLFLSSGINQIVGLHTIVLFTLYKLLNNTLSGFWPCNGENSCMRIIMLPPGQQGLLHEDPTYMIAFMGNNDSFMRIQRMWSPIWTTMSLSRGFNIYDSLYWRQGLLYEHPMYIIASTCCFATVSFHFFSSSKQNNNNPNLYENVGFVIKKHCTILLVQGKRVSSTKQRMSQF